METPGANLVEGLRWLQRTFSTRFNRLRQERGHLHEVSRKVAAWARHPDRLAERLA